MRYVRFDTTGLDHLPEVDRYAEAGAAIEQARQAVADTAAYRDAVVAAMVEARPYRGGPAEVARLLGISTGTVSTHVKKHKERQMPTVYAWGDTITRTPAIRTTYRHGAYEAEAIGRTGPLASAIYQTSQDADALDELVGEIAPWLPVLDALAEEDTAHTARTSVTRSLDAWEVADTPREERYLWKELQTVVSLHQTPADVDAARQSMDARGLTHQQQEDAAPMHIADRVAARLAAQADQAHQRAVAAAPGEVPELLPWETPKALGKPARKLTSFLKERLSA